HLGPRAARLPQATLVRGAEHAAVAVRQLREVAHVRRHEWMRFGHPQIPAKAFVQWCIFSSITWVVNHANPTL
ncbi:MAG: hypothetical protein AAF483_04260, partial [Planctomycetota bacterium]